MAGVEESVYSDSELESSESEDEEEPEQRSTTGPRPNAVYNVEAIHSKLEEISRPSEIDWIHFPTLSYEYTGEEIDVDDDLAREVFFYTQALEGARDAIEKLRPLKIPIVRPDDYYAEMVKSDKHMLRIKDKLLFQKQQIEEADQRRKQREAKKYSKEVQAEKVKERVQEKKRNIESLKKWRKNREESGYADEKDDFPIDLEDSKAPEGKRRKVENGAQDRGGSRVSSLSRGTGPSRKRQERDKKFGNGGRKGMMKKNTAESSADIGGFIKKFGGGRGDFKRGSRGGRGDFKRGSRGGRGEFRGGSRGGSRGGGKGKR